MYIVKNRDGTPGLTLYAKPGEISTGTAQVPCVPVVGGGNIAPEDIIMVIGNSVRYAPCHSPHVRPASRNPPAGWAPPTGSAWDPRDQ